MPGTLPPPPPRTDTKQKQVSGTGQPRAHQPRARAPQPTSTHRALSTPFNPPPTSLQHWLLSKPGRRHGHQDLATLCPHPVGIQRQGQRREETNGPASPQRPQAQPSDSASHVMRQRCNARSKRSPTQRQPLPGPPTPRPANRTHNLTGSRRPPGQAGTAAWDQLAAHTALSMVPGGHSTPSSQYCPPTGRQCHRPPLSSPAQPGDLSRTTEFLQAEFSAQQQQAKWQKMHQTSRTSPARVSV